MKNSIDPAAPVQKITALFLQLSFLVAVFLLAAFKMYEPDSWWHLKTGELIARSGFIPHVDPFTYTVAGAPWTSHQWLAEVIFYLVFAAAGPAGLIIFKAAVVTLTFWLLLRIFLNRHVNRILAAAIILCGAYLVRPMFVERPYILTYLLLALFFYILDRYRDAGSRLLYLLPALTCLWANLHAGFIFGLIAMGIYVFENIVRALFFKSGPAHGIDKRLPVVAGLSLLAALLNPHGYHALIHPFLIVKLYAAGGLIGSGMLPPTLREFPLFFFLLLLLVFSVLLTFRKLRLADGLSMVCFTYLALSSRRGMEPFLIMTGPVLGRHLQLLLEKIGTKRFAGFRHRDTIAAVVNVLAGIALVTVAGLLLDTQKHLEFGLGVNSSMYPEKAVRFIREHDVHGNMYNEPDWGGYLIWRLYPQWKVFVDSRGDVCQDVLRDLQPAGGQADWNGIVRKYGIDYAVMGYTEMVYAEGLTGGRTLPQKDWALVYWDDVSMVYVKRIPAMTRLIKTFEYRYVKPDLDLAYLDGYLRSGNVNPVLLELERKISEDPESFRAHLAYGYLLGRLGMQRQAMREFETVLRINKREKKAREMLDMLQAQTRRPPS